VNRVESIYRCVHHVRLWLAATGVTYGPGAREQFVTAHPLLFGRAYEVTCVVTTTGAPGHGVTDSPEAFARYTGAPARAMARANTQKAPVAPVCDTAQPCWRTGAAASSADVDLQPAA